MTQQVIEFTRSKRNAKLALLSCLLALAPGAAHATSEDSAICRTISGVMRSTGAIEGPVLMAQAEVPASPPTQAVQKSEAKADDAEALTRELSDMLQACSYDGKAMTVQASSLKDSGNTDGEAVVRDIMRFTGLPQNFKVVEGPVPNAAAMIVLGPDRLPQRVIAYNARFIEQVREATKNSDWASVSIMAHEIGHHLSGHTLLPGGSQPPIELEADKFSGFVLYKMGAELGDAQKAISTLVPVADGPTHPGRTKRLAAVESGWTESCGQQAGGCKPGATVVAQNEPAKENPPSPSKPAANAAAKVDIPGPADIRMPGDLDGLSAAGSENAIVTAEIDKVPALDPASTPGKFDRFVYDEVGVFAPKVKEQLARRSYAFASAHNVEIVTIVAKDLQGRTADQFALDAMRQLRVGKLDVGNGAVLVVAPEAKQTGVALGAGLAIQYQNNDGLRRYLDSYLKLVEGGARPERASDLIVDASSRIMRDTQPLEWNIRYQSLTDMQKAAADYRQQQKTAGVKYDPAQDPTWRKLVRVRASVVSTSPDKANRRLAVNAAKERHSGPAMEVRTEDGKTAVVYVNPSVKALMPSALEEGRNYAFVVRDSFAAEGAPKFDLVSYDLLK